jgi:hypothetical protein
MPPTKNDELKGQSHLVRIVAATLDIKLPAEKEILFRGSLLRKAKAELAGLSPQFLVRLFESAAGTDFPDADVVEFRQDLEIHLARYLDLAQFKASRPTTAAK